MQIIGQICAKGNMERKKRRNIKDEKNVRGKRKGMCVEDRVEKRELTNFKRVVRFGAMFSLIFSSVIKEKGKKYVKPILHYSARTLVQHWKNFVA